MITIIRTKKLEELQELVKKANSKVLKIQTEYDDLKRTTDRVLKTSNREISDLCAKLDVKIQNEQKLIDDIKRLEMELSKKTESNEKLGQASGGLRTSNNRLQEKNKDLEKENKVLKHEVKVANELVESLNADNKKFQETDKNLREIITKLQNKANSLKNPKTLDEYKNDGLSKPQKESLKNIRRKRGK